MTRGRMFRLALLLAALVVPAGCGEEPHRFCSDTELSGSGYRLRCLEPPAASITEPLRTPQPDGLYSGKTR